MLKVELETFEFDNELVIQEIKNLTNIKDIKELDDGLFEINFETKEELYDVVINLIYYSRLIYDINLIENNKEIDLIGFDLSKREYRINSSDSYLDPTIVNYLLYLLEIDKLEKKFSLIDPISGYGDVIIEASLFNPRKPLNVKNRFKLNISKHFNKIPEIVKSEVDKNKYISIVQDNIEFKKTKENLNHCSQKIKVSKYDLDWLDIKHEENSIDYVVTYFPDVDKEHREDILKETLYQCEYICRDKIAIITHEKIDSKVFKEFKLKLDIFKNLELEGGEIFIYIFKITR